MSRLIVFGCSFAYGFALPDCFDRTMRPSKFCWPVIVANAMNRRLINKAWPASSNKRIWHTIKNFKFKPDDIVIISWSYGHRSCIIKNKWNVKNLINSDTDELESLAYYEHIYAWYDSVLMSRLFVDDANNFLTKKSITVHNLFLNSDWHSLLKNDHVVVPIHMEDYIDNYPKALDNSHPGLECNRAYAIDFLNYVGIDHTIQDKPLPYSFFEKLKRIICKLI